MKGVCGSILLTIYFFYRAFGVNVTLYGNGDFENGQTAFLMGGCKESKVGSTNNFTEISKANIQNKTWEITTDISPCFFQWKWRIGNSTWENDHTWKSGHNDRENTIPNISKPLYIYTTFNIDGGGVFVDQDAVFVLERIPYEGKSYSVCGHCADAGARPDFRGWDCGSPASTQTDGKISVRSKLTSPCNFEWKWLINEDKIYEHPGGSNRIISINAGCDGAAILVIRSNWSVYESAADRECMELSALSSISSTEIKINTTHGVTASSRASSVTTYSTGSLLQSISSTAIQSQTNKPGSTADVRATFYGSGDGTNGQNITLMGGCKYNNPTTNNFKEISSTVITNNQWELNLRIPSCLLQWKWKIGKDGWENDHTWKDGHKDRETLIPNSSRHIHIYSTFNNEDAKVFVDQDVTFILDKAPNPDVNYQVCGHCSGGDARPGFRDWECGKPVSADKDGRVNVGKGLTVPCVYEWKWFTNGTDNDEYEFPSQGNRRLVLAEACDETKPLVINSTWSAYESAADRKCLEVTDKSTIGISTEAANLSNPPMSYPETRSPIMITSTSGKPLMIPTIQSAEIKAALAQTNENKLSAGYISAITVSSLLFVIGLAVSSYFLSKRFCWTKISLHHDVNPIVRMQELEDSMNED